MTNFIVADYVSTVEKGSTVCDLTTCEGQSKIFPADTSPEELVAYEAVLSKMDEKTDWSLLSFAVIDAEFASEIELEQQLKKL